MINFILWLIVGGLAGWLASRFMGTDAQQGLFLNIVVGIIGAYIGGFIASLFGISVSSFSILGFIIAVVGACILLFVLQLLTGRRRV